VDWIHLAQDKSSGGLLCHGNECSGYIKGGEFLERLIECHFLKGTSAA
jgi:hypothetical protein